VVGGWPDADQRRARVEACLRTDGRSDRRRQTRYRRFPCLPLRVARARVRLARQLRTARFGVRDAGARRVVAPLLVPFQTSSHALQRRDARDFSFHTPSPGSSHLERRLVQRQTSRPDRSGAGRSLHAFAQAPLGPIGLKAEGSARCPPRRSAAGRHGSPQADLGRLQSRAEAPAAPDRGERCVAEAIVRSEVVTGRKRSPLGSPGGLALREDQPSRAPQVVRKQQSRRL
jgi:hypothetical protein